MGELKGGNKHGGKNKYTKKGKRQLFGRQNRGVGSQVDSVMESVEGSD